MSVEFQFHEGIFEKITNVQWPAGALRIDASASNGVLPTITMTPTGLADSPYFSMTLCFRVNSDTSLFGTEFFEISPLGLSEDSSLFDATPGVGVGFSFNPGTGPGVEGLVQLFVGAKKIINIHDFTSYSNTDDPGNDPFASFDALAWRPYSSTLLFIPNGTYNRNDYNHLVISQFTDVLCASGEGTFVDPNEVYPILTGPRFNATLNGVPLYTKQDAPNTFFGQSFDKTISRAIGNRDVLGFGADTFPQQLTGTTTFKKLSVPGFNIGYSGFSLDIPVNQVFNVPSGPNNFASLDLFDMRVWTNQFVAMSQLPLFINRGTGALQPPSTAETVLGKPQFWLSGGPSRFEQNRGSASSGGAIVFEPELLSATRKPKQIVVP